MENEYDVIEILNKMNRRIDHNGVRYRMVIVRMNEDWHNDAWSIYYSKENQNGYSTANYLLKADGKTLAHAIIEMRDEYNFYWDLKRKIGCDIDRFTKISRHDEKIKHDFSFD